MDEKNSFIGQGWSFPPTFFQSERGVEMTAGEKNVEENIRIILSTIPGERILHPDFGCNLHAYVFEEFDQQLITGIRTLVYDALLEYEPRIHLNEVTVQADRNDSVKLIISVEYTLRTTNSRYNLVYPFYLNEHRSPLDFPVGE